MRTWRVVAAVSVLALSGCVSVPRGTPSAPLDPQLAAAALEAQADRERVLAAAPDWALEGRVAIARGRDGGSGRIDWRQDGPAFDVSLSAPVTRQSWRLAGTADGATLEGLEGGVRRGPDAAALLLEATRLEVPVPALASWVRGARADEARFGPARLRFDTAGRPLQLVQGGWTIDYVTWGPAVDGLPALPVRLDAARGHARVRLVVDAWQALP